MTTMAITRRGLYRMGPIETASGLVTGRQRGPLVRPAPAAGDPVAALEVAVLPALCRPPCVVQFSGGRDSSLVLAAAVRAARRHGLPEPVALTRRFPALAETDESEWQQRVLRHLGVREWECIIVADELDAVGPIVGPSLERRGLVWPPLLHQRQLDLARARGGSLVDGEGGDEVFGPARLAPLVALAQFRHGDAQRGSMRAAALSLSPQVVRRTALRRLYRAQTRLPWLRPEAWARIEHALAADHAAMAADWRQRLRSHLESRGVALFLSNYTALGEEHDVEVFHPLLEPGVLAAVGAVGGRIGFDDRTAAMTATFGDLLPAAVLGRTTKAGFNGVAFNVHSRSFVAGWRGEGVDGSLVDVEALRATWTSPRPHGLSLGLLQAAWLASRHRASAP